MEVDFSKLKEFILNEEEREMIIDNVLGPTYHIQEIFSSLLLLLFKKDGELSISQIDREELKKRMGNLKMSNPDEQELFSLVYDVNMDCNRKNYKFRPYKIFKENNKKYNLVDNQLIKEEKFSKSDLYNRYKQYRTRRNKKEYSNTPE